MTSVETYVKGFEAFESRICSGAPVWLRDLRRAAIERFSALGFPGPKDESWRFTRVRPLLSHDFRLTPRYDRTALSSRQIEELSMEDTGFRRLAFVNGHFAEDLSDGGLFVATYEAVPLNSPVRVVFELPCGTRVSAPGRVAWVREPLDGHAPGVGVAFEALSDEQREAILGFVRERPPLFYDVDG